MNLKHGIILILVLIAVIAGIAGVRGMKSVNPPPELFIDMKRQGKINPQSYYVLPSGELPRKVDKTITFSPDSNQDEVITGLIKGTTNYVEIIPVIVDKKLLERGKERYEIFCSNCHGLFGDGITVSRRIGAMPIVASLHDLRIVKMTDGEIFNVITHGRNLMGAHGGMIPAADRWAIVGYVRALQISKYGFINELTDAEKNRLNSANYK